MIEKLDRMDDERAVSPVIGVILMVAITVILAAVIGTFVLGLGGQVSQTAPQATITMSDAADSVPTTADTNFSVVKISHDGGEQIESSNIEIVVRNQSTDAVMERLSGDFVSDNGEMNITYNGMQSFNKKTFQSGDTLVLNDIDDGSHNRNFSADSDVRIIIVDSGTGQQIAAQTIDIK